MNENHQHQLRDLSKKSNTLVVFTYNLFIIILYAHYFKYKKCYVEQNITAFQKSPRVLSLTASVEHATIITKAFNEHVVWASLYGTYTSTKGSRKKNKVCTNKKTDYYKNV